MTSINRYRRTAAHWLALSMVCATFGCTDGGSSGDNTGSDTVADDASGTDIGTATTLGSTGDSGGTGTSAGTGTSGGTGVTDDDPLPEPCRGGVTPFTHAACGAALRAECRAQTTEADCTGHDPFVFDGGAYGFGCAWARVVTIADPTTCQVRAVQWRCEAGITPGVGCGLGPCGELPGLYDAWSAIANDGELIEMGCFGNAAIDGPIGPWNEIGSQQGDDSATRVASCGASDPAPPAICDCSTAACTAVADRG